MVKQNTTTTTYRLAKLEEQMILEVFLPVLIRALNSNRSLSVNTDAVVVAAQCSFSTMIKGKKKADLRDIPLS